MTVPSRRSTRYASAQAFLQRSSALVRSALLRILGSPVTVLALVTAAGTAVHFVHALDSAIGAYDDARAFARPSQFEVIQHIYYDVASGSNVAGALVFAAAIAFAVWLRFAAPPSRTSAITWRCSCRSSRRTWSWGRGS
jgi:hypothetical protein